MCQKSAKFRHKRRSAKERKCNARQTPTPQIYLNLALSVNFSQQNREENKKGPKPRNLVNPLFLRKYRENGVVSCTLTVAMPYAMKNGQIHSGKGEFPGNGRNFWSKLTDNANDLQGKLGNTKYTVFGLGDSHYWGKGTEDSKVNFAKPARDLDAVLEKLGATRFINQQDTKEYLN